MTVLTSSFESVKSQSREYIVNVNLKHSLIKGTMQLFSGLSYSLSEVGRGFYVLSDPGYWAGPWAGAHLLPMSIMPDQLLDRRGSL